MRIVIPNRAVADSFVDNVRHALNEMGHEVITLPPVAPDGVTMRFTHQRDGILRRVVRDYVSAEEKRMLGLVREARPEMLLALTQSLSPSTLREVRRLGVKRRVAWWGDSPANMQQMGLLTDEWDAIFVKDPDFAGKLRRVRLNAHLLHEAMNPDWHRAVSTQQNNQLVIVGNFYAYRQFLVRRLLDEGVELGLYGGPRARWADPDIDRIHTGRFVVKEDKSRVFGEGLACLNSTHVVEGNSLNCRAFEIAGAAGLQIMEARPIVETCFEPGREVLTFDTFDELLAHVERARKSPSEMIAIREAGRARALAQHTYRHRLAELLRIAADS